MRLHSHFDSSHAGVSNYHIEPARTTPRTIFGASKKETAKLFRLQPRIERMARQELGRAYVGMNRIGFTHKILELRVKQGTSKNPKTRAAMREFLGWVSLVGAEPGRGKN